MSEQSNEEILKGMFEKLPDVYDSFAKDITDTAKRNNIVDQLIEYMENTPDATTSTVLEKIADLKGIKKVYTGE